MLKDDPLILPIAFTDCGEAPKYCLNPPLAMLYTVKLLQDLVLPMVSTSFHKESSWLWGKPVSYSCGVKKSSWILKEQNPAVGGHKCC